MPTLTSRQARGLVGDAYKAARLAEACRALDVGRTSQGVERRFSPVEAMRLTLYSRLQEHGLRAGVAAELAREGVTLDDWAEIVAEDADVWLAVRPDPGGPTPYVYALATPDEAVDFLGEDIAGLILIPLEPIAYAVLTAAEAGAGGAGHGAD